jgi:hypothetical protein
MNENSSLLPEGITRHRTMAATLIACGLLAACQSAPPPTEMSRTTLQTAPADLQLLCANAVAGPAKIDSSKILPIGSRALDAESFNVELNANGKRFNCVVDNKGVVRSVQAI